MDTKQLHLANQAAWNQAALAYEREIAEDVEFLQSGGTDVCQSEREFLTGISGRVIHLQCAGGRDTLSLWNLGADEVIGVDISERMLACAEAKSRALSAPARWVHSDILETPHDLDASADWVYTGRGALNWIMDIDAWAQVIARLLKPGGKFYLFEGHPITFLFDMEADHLKLDTEQGDYFTNQPACSEGWPTTYVGDVLPRAQQATKYERLWKISDTLGAVRNAGLHLLRFEEHSEAYWKEFPNLPEDIRRRFPNTFSLLAEKR
jgi:ubiquinone/menaquinone biosynthesis C-methylase UbiE